MFAHNSQLVGSYFQFKSISAGYVMISRFRQSWRDNPSLYLLVQRGCPCHPPSPLPSQLPLSPEWESGKV